jgi:hypothetical protein
MITRRDILGQAFEECMNEMYKWSQPSIDLKALIASGYKDSEKEPLHDRHYLSQENFKIILEHYMWAYGIVDNWNDTFELIYKQLKEGGIEDDYKPATEDRPGYRDYKHVDPLAPHLKDPEDIQVVLEYIKKIQDFFRGHCRECNGFSQEVALSYSPSCNAKAVTKYWKEHGRPDFEIKNFNTEDVIYGSEDYEDISVADFIETLK